MSSFDVIPHIGLGRWKLCGVTVADGMGYGESDRVLRRGMAYSSSTLPQMTRARIEVASTVGKKRFLVDGAP